MTDLPVNEVLPDLIAALDKGTAAVLIAPPGAGKTTAVAPELIRQSWCDGQIILLSPRRVAARAAAERMAETLGEKAGETVGYLTRLDSKQSAKTRILVMTEAIFVNRIVEDPELSDVSAVLFDESHERHLDSDLGLALAIESQQVVRPDLRLLVMSATIDGARFAELIGPETPVVESEGRSYPLTIEWLGSQPDLRIEDQMERSIRQAWREQEGDILAFLPGVGEIERTRERLEAGIPSALILPLHGQTAPAEQRRAIRSDPEGRRRIVLATNIAESSVTLDGVSVVVDSGLTRRAEFDRAAGTMTLLTTRSSQAAADQRAGRAARQRPGIAYRLWEEGGHAGRLAYDPPEIERVDLTGTMLRLAQWGTREPQALPWLDGPPAASISLARKRLLDLSALNEDGDITDWGRKLARLPMEPMDAAMILRGASSGEGRQAARLALLLQERSLGGRGEDLQARLERWANDKSQRARQSAKLADRWADLAQKLVGESADESRDLSVIMAQSRPEFIARRRDPSGEGWQSVGGRGYRLDPTSPLARSEWIVIGDAVGAAKGARIVAGMAIEREAIDKHLGQMMESRSIIRWDPSERKVETLQERRLGAIKLSSVSDAQADSAEIEGLLFTKAMDQLDELLPVQLVLRLNYAELLDSVRANAESWLPPILQGRRDLNLSASKFADAALALLPWEDQQRLERAAPRNWTSPAGTSHAINYASEGGPAVEVRVQALFGLDTHPMIGSVPLLLQLTSPAGRPVQSTQDLPGFWRGSWQDVRKDMAGRYPKHRWPEKPWLEKPSLKTKNAFARSEKPD